MRLIILLAIFPSLAIAQIANTGTPSIGSGGGSGGSGGGASGNITATRFNCTPTLAPVSTATGGAATTIPTTTCLVIISATPDGSFTLTGTPFANGTIDGQMMRVGNATGNAIVISHSATNILISTGVDVTIAAGGSQAEWTWIASIPAWVYANGSNVVDLTSAQTIGGVKTFTGDLTLFPGGVSLGVQSVIPGRIFFYNNSGTGFSEMFANQNNNTNTNFNLPGTNGSVGQTLVNTDGAGAMAWSALNLAGIGITGVLPVANGGTGSSTILADDNFFASLTANLTTGVIFGQAYFARASTLDTGKSVITPQVIGIGAGAFVIKACGDGATCSVVYLTCTSTCLGTVGTPVACTVTTAAIPAATTLSFSVTTSCATDPILALNGHATTP